MVSGQQQPEFLPLRGLANILTVLLAAVLALIGGRLAIDFSSLGGAHWRHNLIEVRLDKAADITMFAFSILFVVWFRRARIDGELHDYPQRRARGWAFWGWIVPIVSIWFPFQIMGDIWRAGLPDHRRRKTAWLPALWWTCWLLSGLSFGGQATTGNVLSVPDLDASSQAFSLCFLALAGIFLMPIIRVVSVGPVGPPW